MKKIVLLLGPSSSGKTTLCGELEKRHKWISIEMDTVIERMFSEFNKKAKLEIVPLLQERDLIHQLSSLMLQEQIIHFALTGDFSLKNDTIKDYQFPKPSLPNLESVLEKAGIHADNISKVAAQLREITTIGQQYKKTHSFPTQNEIYWATIDEAFNNDGPNSTIIIDIVPDPDADPNKIKDMLDKRKEQYLHEHPAHEVEIVVVLAICAPQTLNARIQRRNLMSEQKDNKQDQRVGTFPFHQLSRLIHAQNKPNKWQEITFSREEAFEICRTHSSPAPDDSREFEPIGSNHYKVGHGSIVAEYKTLAYKFGFSADPKIKLSVGCDVYYDLIIRTDEKTPQELADDLVDEVAICITPSHVVYHY